MQDLIEVYAVTLRSTISHIHIIFYAYICVCYTPRKEDIEVRLADWHMLDGPKKGLKLAHGVHLWL